MTQLGEAIARYQKILQTAPHPGLGWAQQLQDRMVELNLKRGVNPVCLFLRPNFITRRQYASLVKTTETLASAVNRLLEMALADPVLLGRMGLLPGEKMLAAIDPGYPQLLVTSYFDTYLDPSSNNGFKVAGHHWDAAPRIAYETALSDLFYHCSPMKQFRRHYQVTKFGGAKELVSALLATYKAFGGRRRPHVGILDFRVSYQTTGASELYLLREMFRKNGLIAEVVFPEELEYRNGVLRQGEFPVDLIWRRVRVQDFLLRFDLTHPVVRAYQDRAVCMISSFRAELAQKRTVLCLLSDETVTAKFPAAERKAIADHIPWTRLVTPGKTQYKGQTIDLLDFVARNRESLVLMSNDADADEHLYLGWETQPSTWEKVIKHAARVPVVVQERTDPPVELFPIYRYQEMVQRKVMVDTRPYLIQGKVQGCASWLWEEVNGLYSSLEGPVPTYIIEPRS